MRNLDLPRRRSGLDLGRSVQWVVLGLMALVVLVLAGCQERAVQKADGYVALVPRVLRSGETASFSFSLLKKEQLISGDVAVALMQKDRRVAEGQGRIKGKGTVEVKLPRLASGAYQLVVNGPGFSDKTEVQVQEGTLLFVETDKPIYKPGQTIRLRLVALDSELKPISTKATAEVLDAKGVKVFKKAVSTDEFGTATLELPLSEEPNLGVWKARATAGHTSTEVDVRVDKYVLPKYGVEVDLPRDCFLVNEPITGRVKAEYSFGRPVRGELRVKASRYVGVWQEFAAFTGSIDGEGDFRLNPPGYSAGVPGAGGQAKVQLEVTVAEKTTGYKEKTTELVTVAAAPVNIKLIPESPVFKPSLPFNVLLVTETPDNRLVEATVSVQATFLDDEFNEVGRERQNVETKSGGALVRLTPPDRAVQMRLNASSGEAQATKEVGSAYSPSGNFIHVEQELKSGQVGSLNIGETARFRVSSTSEARTFYYEVVSRDRVVFTGSGSDKISFRVTPAMAPAAQLLVYQILPNTEVAADALPFQVNGEYPHKVHVSFETGEAEPGEKVRLNVQTEGRAKVGLVAVDRSVFMLAENRINLQQVFAVLERLYMEPQAELHEAEPMSEPLVIPGAKETFQSAGLIVLSDKRVPEGKELDLPKLGFPERARLPPAAGEAPTTAAAGSPAAGRPDSAASDGPAAVKRVRQFFPETWIWQDTITDKEGQASLSLKAPDSITTWDLRAVALSPEKGLGIAETSLRVFQPFFFHVDLPYSAIRGEEFPVRVALYNYLENPQKLTVRIDSAPWFDLLDDAEKTVTVGGKDIGRAEFRIRPKSVGTKNVKITARSRETADAVEKSLIVEPEGVAREQVSNTVLAAGGSRTLDLALPRTLIPDSARAYLALSGSLLAQTIDGLDRLLQMPFGCGEQNMILFAPDTFILRYLKETGQLKPEIRAKAEGLLVTGYQRELTYRRADGSFSAFGDQDKEGSLFLTAFLLKTFAQAKDLVYIDNAVLADAARWIVRHQRPDGSFEAVGFVAHQELMGGVQGKDALTAYVAIALFEAGQTDAAKKALGYLEDRLQTIKDPYTLALVSYALELGKSDLAKQAHEKLMAAAVADEDCLHWGDGDWPPVREDERNPAVGAEPFAAAPQIAVPVQSTYVEATGYAALALIHGDHQTEASRAAKWLVSHRNSLGGFGSTQDTVVALQALTEYAALSSADSDLTVTVTAGETTKKVRITPENFDVTQVVELPTGVSVRLDAVGKGQAVVQGVLRYNVPRPEEVTPVFDIDVRYDATQFDVDDVVDVDVEVTFNPPKPLKAGMVVLDVAVPTGFAAVDESPERLIQTPKVKRYDVAGRKVIVYLEDMAPGEKVSFSFQVRALYPVRGKGGVSEVYSYYNPQWKGTTVNEALTVLGM